MSEITNSSCDRTNSKAKLLATACGAALLVASYQPAMALGDDGPVVWIELGGAFTRVENSQDSYLPPFTLAAPRLPFITVSPADIERSAPTSWDGDAKIVFESSGTDWVLSAGINYGRSIRKDTLRQQTTQRSQPFNGQYEAYQNSVAKSDESHMILDFLAGKDVGLGVFGKGGRSIVNIGMRYAQLNSTGDMNVSYRPTNNVRNYNKFSGSLYAKRKFTGVGPSLSWDASAELTGDVASGGISFDWGMNGAILFGRQQVRGHHQTTNFAVTYYRGQNKNPVYQHSVPLTRSKQVVVPDLGGFAGMSWRYPDAKVSMGYRADFFFGAMDGGIDVAHRENVGFYGPFASVSVGFP